MSHRIGSPVSFAAAIVALIVTLSSSSAIAVEPALFSTLEDGSVGVLMPTPDTGLPNPAQTPFVLPVGPSLEVPAPHGVSFRGGHEALFSDFARPVLYRSLLATPGVAQTVALTGRTSGNGTLAATADGRYALSVGSSITIAGAGESVVIDFSGGVPVVTPIVPTMRVMGFVTAAIDFAPDGRAFVCHSTGVSVLKPPYTTVEFTMPFPALTQSGSMCRLTRDGGRLFVTRLMSEAAITVSAVRTTTAPYSASSVFVAMPVPATVQGLGPMAVSPDGQALLVGQQFLFPAPFESPPRARAFVLRAPYTTSTAYEELVLPASVAGSNCLDGATARDCPGFEHIEVSDDGSLAVLTGNSSSVATPAADRVPSVFVRNPFDIPTRSVVAVQVAPATPVPGRGSGAMRFQPARVFRDGLETP